MWPRLARVLRLVPAGGLVLLVSAGSATAQQRAIFELVVNGVDKGEALVLVDGADLWVEVDTLAAAGLRDIGGRRTVSSGRSFVSLGSLAPALGFTVDDATLTVRITAPAELFGRTVVAASGNRPGDVVYSHDNAAFVNYGARYASGGQLDLSAEAGVHVRGALASSTLTRDPEGRVGRGYSHVLIDDRARLRRWTIGDAVVSTGLLGGGGVIGGLSVASEYGLDPYLVRYPTLGFSGALETPSTLEVYVNDQLVSRQDLPPGQFSLDNIPAPMGGHDARLVIRDAFGREREVSSPYYLTNSVLAKGRQEYQYTIGLPRLLSAGRNFAYEAPAFLGSHRFGLTDQLSVGGRLEASGSMVSGGMVVNARLSHFGEIELASGASRDRGANGFAFSAGYGYVGRPVSLSASFRAFSARYAMFGLDGLRWRPRWELDASTGFQLGQRVRLHVQQAFGATRSSADGVERPLLRTALSAQSGIGKRLSVFLSGSIGHEAGASARSLLAGVNVWLGTRTSATVAYESVDGQSSPQVEVQRMLAAGEGWGYRARISQAGSAPSSGLVQYQGRYGRYELEQAGDRNGASTRLSVSGGLAAIGGSLFASRPIQQSFALIRVPGVAGVTGFASNQEVGKTDRNGNLLVPDLLPYYGNLLRIADKDIPLHFSLAGTETRVAPPYRGGAVVTFPARRIQALSGTLMLQKAGHDTVPAFGRFTVTARGQLYESPIGRNGEYYFENLPPGRHQGVIEFREDSCGVEFDVPDSRMPELKLGIIRCEIPANVAR